MGPMLDWTPTSACGFMANCIARRGFARTGGASVPMTFVVSSSIVAVSGNGGGAVVDVVGACDPPRALTGLHVTLTQRAILKSSGRVRLIR